MSKHSLVLLGVFLLLSAVPTNSQQVECSSNDDFLCTYASLYYFPPGPTGYSMIEVIGWVMKTTTISELGVQLYDTKSKVLYNWQLIRWDITYLVDPQPKQFFYAPWFLLAGLPSSTYNGLFGVFDQSGTIIYELPFSFIY